jgi:hypothetical protein
MAMTDWKSPDVAGRKCKTLSLISGKFENQSRSDISAIFSDINKVPRDAQFPD